MRQWLLAPRCLDERSRDSLRHAACRRSRSASISTEARTCLYSLEQLNSLGSQRAYNPRKHVLIAYVNRALDSRILGSR